MGNLPQEKALLLMARTILKNGFYTMQNPSE